MVPPPQLAACQGEVDTVCMSIPLPLHPHTPLPLPPSEGKQDRPEGPDGPGEPLKRFYLGLGTNVHVGQKCGATGAPQPMLKPIRRN